MEDIPKFTCSMKVTPDVAADWLDNRNLAEDRPYNNRVMSSHIVDKYAEVMGEGRWLLTHQGIAFDVEGWLLDGQHRLKAVIRSGVPTEFTIHPDCDPRTFAILDTGYKRTAGQLIPVNGHAIAAAARIVGTVTGAWPLRGAAGGIYDGHATNDQVLAANDAWPEITEYAPLVTACYQAVRINKATHLAVIAQAARIGHPEPVFTDWFNALKTGEDLAGDDPRLHLRNRFVREFRELNSSGGRGMAYRLIARAWNAYSCRRPMKLLRPYTDQPPPEIR